MLFNFPYFFKYKTYFILCLVSLNSLSLYKPASSTHCFCWLLSYVFVIFDCELIFLETVSEFLQRQYVLLLSVTWKALKICYHFKFLVWGFFRLPRLFKQTSFRAACDYIYIYSQGRWNVFDQDRQSSLLSVGSEGGEGEIGEGGGRQICS